MIITKVVLQNWQGYYGGQHEFNFDGQFCNNGIIYADNTTGKSAFWESIEFVLFDEVEWGKGTKKWVSPESGDRPLMNCDAFNEKNGSSASVELYFKSSFSGIEEEYNLCRRIVPKKKAGSQQGDDDYKIELTLHNLEDSTKPFPKIDNRWLEEKIISKPLKRFCLFDGARLERYAVLLQPEEVREDYTLRDDIQQILKTTALKEGVQHFSKVHDGMESQLGKLRAQAERDETKRAALEQINEDIKQAEEEVDLGEEEVQNREDGLKELDRLLDENESANNTVTKIKSLEEEVKGFQKGIDGKREDIKNGVKRAWRSFISNEVSEAMDGLEQSTLAQGELREKTGAILERIKGLESEKEGEECPMCKHVHELPEDKRIKEIDIEINELRGKVSELRENSKHPTQEVVVAFRKAINPMVTNDRMLDDLIAKESSLMSDIKTREKKQGRIKELRGSLKENFEDEVANLERRRDTALGKLASAGEQLKHAQALVDVLKKERSGMHKPKDGDEEDEKTRLMAKSCEVAKKLAQLVQETLDIWTGKAREDVEDMASELFLDISNNRDNYDGLKIMPDFSVQIRNKKNAKDAGSQAQSMIIAYCLIDALGRKSGREFPMIIDTPIRGMGSKIRDKVFDHLTTMERQFIAMPYDLELDIETGDKKYAQYLAASYEIEKIENDRSKVVLRPGDNLRRD